MIKWIKTMKNLLIGLLLGGGTPLGAHDLSVYENYLNTLHRLEAHLIQESPDGSIYNGYLWLEKPDKLRIEYDPSHSSTLVACKGEFYTYDHKTKEVSLCAVEDTPASFFLRPSLHFKGDITVEKVDHKAGIVRLTLIQNQDKEAGSLTLVFQDSPLELRQWIITDSTGQETKVTLSERRINRTPPLEGALFNPQFLSRRFMALESPVS